MTSLREPPSPVTHLPSHEVITAWARDTIGAASQHQIWFAFLDGDDQIMPVVVPIDDLPLCPPAEAQDGFSGLISTVRSAAPNSGFKVITVLERPGKPSLTESDHAWLAEVAGACASLDVALRAVLLNSSHGVRMLTDEPGSGDSSMSETTSSATAPSLRPAS